MDPTWGLEQEFEHNVWPAVEGVDGWMRKEELKLLCLLAYLLPTGGRIVEIGSWCGRSSIALSWHGHETYCVDPWDRSGGPQYLHRGVADPFAEWIYNTREARVNPIPLVGTSERINRAWTLPIDLLVIDGDHNFPGVDLDVALWTPFLKVGGILAMDDYLEPGPNKVIRERLCANPTQWSRGFSLGKLFISRKESE